MYSIFQLYNSWNDVFKLPLLIDVDNLLMLAKQSVTIKRAHKYNFTKIQLKITNVFDVKFDHL